MTTVIKTTLPFHHDFNLYQGQDWSAYIVRKDASDTPIDLTGWTARMQIRKSRGGDVIQTLTSSPAAGLTFDVTNGKLTMALTATQTGAFKVSKAEYDLFMTNAGGTETICVLEGTMHIGQRVTLPA